MASDAHPATEAAPQPWGRMRALHSRSFRRWFVGHCVSQSGFFAQSIALGVLVLETTDSAFAVSVVAAIQYLPIVVIGPFAGVIGDRFDRRFTLAVIQLTGMIEAVALTLLVVLDATTYWLLLVVAAAIGVTFSFDQPIRRSLITDLVPVDSLVNAVSLAGTVGALAKVIGPAIGAVTTSALGVEWTFGFNAASSVVLIAALWSIGGSESGQLLAAETSARRLLGDTLRYIRVTAPVKVSFLCLAALSVFAYNWDLMLLLLTDRSLGGGAGTYGLLTSCFGVGALAGTFTVASRPAPSHTQISRWTIWYGLSCVAVGLASPVAPVAATCVLAGVLLIPVFIGVTTLAQTTSEPTMRARMMSFFSVIFIGGQAVGALLMGALAELVGVRSAIAAGGATVAAAGAALTRSARATLTSEPKEPA